MDFITVIIDNLNHEHLCCSARRSDYSVNRNVVISDCIILDDD